MRGSARLSDGCIQLCNSARRPQCCSNQKPRESKARSTPLPKLQVLVAGAVLLNNHFGAILLFPFLPFMVQDFFPELSKEELGKKAGYLGSIYFAGSFAGSLLWGCLADHWGRRPVIMLGICGSIFSELLFGFSQNFSWALSARFLWGMLNGNLGVAKTFISEVCDNSNLAKGFAVVGASGGIGRLIGSTLGGFLAQPASKYALFEHPFFCRYPYLLPCLSAASLAFLSLIVTCLFMEETMHKGRFSQLSVQQRSWHSLSSERDVADFAESDSTDVEMVSLSSDVVLVETEQLTNQITESDVDLQSVSNDSTVSDSDTDLLLRTEDMGVAYKARHGQLEKYIRNLRKFDLSGCINNFVHRQQQQWLECCWCCVCTGGNCVRQQTNLTSYKDCLQVIYQIILCVVHGAKRMLKLIRDRRVFLSIMLYVIFGTLSLASQELIPLLFVNDHEHGGYHLDDNEIGVLAMTAAACEFLFQVFFYSPIAKILGFRCMFRTGAMIFLVACVIIPFSNAITGPVSNETNATASGSGSGMWMGSGFNSVDYCGQDTSDSEADINPDSITRLPLRVWVMAEVALLSLVLSSLLGITSVMVMIGNSSLTETRGTINGMSQSLVAVLRFVVPALAALGLAWSEGNVDKGYGWPVNYHFAFDIFALLTLLTIFISFFLPKSIETKR